MFYFYLNLSYCYIVYFVQQINLEKNVICNLINIKKNKRILQLLIKIKLIITEPSLINYHLNTFVKKCLVCLNILILSFNLFF